MRQSCNFPAINAPGGAAPLLLATSHTHRWLAQVPTLRQPLYRVLIAGQPAHEALYWQTIATHHTGLLSRTTTDASHGGVRVHTQTPRPEPDSEPEPENVTELEIQNEPETTPDERPGPRGLDSAKEESGNRQDGGVNPPFP